MCMCVRVCVRACVHACMHACMHTQRKSSPTVHLKLVGILSGWDFVRLGFCPLGFCPLGFCPLGFCPLGFCPALDLRYAILQSFLHTSHMLRHFTDLLQQTCHKCNMLQDQMTADAGHLNICGQPTAAVARDLLSSLPLQLKHCRRHRNHRTQMDT